MWQGNIFTSVCHSVQGGGVYPSMHLDRHPPGRHPQADIPRQTSPGWHPQADTPTPRWPLHRMVCIRTECFLVASHFRTSEPRFENLSMLPSLDNPGNSKVLWLTCYHPQHICSIGNLFTPAPSRHPPGQTPPPRWEDTSPSQETVTRTVRILLECIFVGWSFWNIWRWLVEHASIIIFSVGNFFDVTLWWFTNGS